MQPDRVQHQNTHCSHILKQNGIDPDSGLTIQWCADTTEALSYIANDSEAIAMLPQPFATAAMGQVDGLRVANRLK